MKRKYLNNEKVSNRYLLMRYEELKAKFAEFRKRKMFFAIQKFDVELNQIYNDAELNNYQKLRKIIELEREFNKYLKTKEFLLDLIYDYIQNDPDAFGLRNSNSQVNGSFVFAFLSGNPDYEIYEDSSHETKSTLVGFMKHRYYGRYIDYARLIKQLTDEDIIGIKQLLAKKYRDIFLADGFARFAITYDDIFLETEGAQIIVFIAKQFMSAYWETFDYPEDSELAQNFKQEVMKNIQEPQRFLELAKNPDFWYMLVNFREYYNFSSSLSFLTRTNSVTSENQELEVRRQEKKLKEKYKLSKSEAIKKLEERSNGKPLSFVFADLDFSGLNLKKYAITTPECTLSNVDFEGTEITIDFSKTNQNPVVCYIKGERIDYRDLTTSCFKGCKIEGASFDVLNEFAFSINTFDVEVLKKAGFYCEDVPENFLDKFYRKKTLSMKKLNMLADKFGIDKVKMRYSNLKVESAALEWLEIKKKVLD